MEIPEGKFFSGTVPGEPGRRPEIEPPRSEVTLGPFTIDKLPYPNDPANPPKTGVSRDDAKRLCAERGARLCTELEWERACKGPKSEPFAGGGAWDERCHTDPKSCASGFDVLALGSLREWTASDVATEGDRKKRKAAIRGASPKAPGPEHRCAARRAVAADTSEDDLGFRCCKGAPNAAVVAEPKLGKTYRKLTLKAAQLEALFAKYPETQAIAKDIKFFRSPEAVNTVIARGPGDRKGFLFSVTPLIWNPVAGAEFLVVSGRSGDKVSFVAAFHVLGKDDYLLASSFIMKDEAGPVALAYNGYIRPRLHFSTCWGCPGETGKILYRDPDGVAIFQP